MRLIYFDTPHYAVACNHKVFTSNLAMAIIGSFYPDLLKRTEEAVEERKKRNRWHGLVPTLMDEKLNKPVVLLFNDPIIKYFAACREDKISYYSLPLELANQKKWFSFHFWPQSRFLVPQKYPVIVFDAARDIAKLYELVGLDKNYLPVDIYSKEYREDELLFLHQELDNMVNIYQDDFSVYGAISSKYGPTEFSELNISLRQSDEYGIDGNFKTLFRG